MIIFIILNNFKYALEVTIVPKYMSFTRQTIFKNVIKSFEDKYTDIKSGKLIAMILDTTREMKDFLFFTLSEGFPIIIGLFLISFYFLYKNTILGLISISGLFISMIITYFVGKKCVNFSRKREHFYINMCEDMNDRFSNLMNIYLNNENVSEISKNNNSEKKHSELYAKQLRMTKLFVLLMNIVSVLTFSVLLLYLYKLVTTKTISLEFFISVVIILIYYMGYLVRISNDLPPILSKLGVIGASSDFLNKIFEQNKNRKNKIKNLKGNINFQNINFRYNEKSGYLFKNLNFKVDANQKIAIIGRSGSGKTTLMKLLLSLYEPTSGKILIDNIDISTVNLKELRNNINYVNQRTQMFSLPIINNMKYGNNINDKDLITLLKKYKLDEVFNELEKGIYTNAGVQGGNMSLGMQKIVMLIRGILKKGKIIIFDEPLAALDVKTRTKVIKLIVEECKNKTIIVITHDKEIMPYMNKVIDLKKMKNNES